MAAVVETRGADCEVTPVPDGQGSGEPWLPTHVARFST